MSKSEYYHNRSIQYKQTADLLQKRENRLSLARLFSFLSAIAFFFILSPINFKIAIIVFIIGIILFGWLVKEYARTEIQKNFYRYLERINYNEEQCLLGNFNNFPDGTEYIDRNHPYSYDLDIFGHASLYQYLNRTTSKPAADLLAEWLKKPAEIEEINSRQAAAKELSEKIEWRQKLISLGYETNSSFDNNKDLTRWTNSENSFINNKQISLISWTLTGFSIVVATLVIAGLPIALLLFALTINSIFYFYNSKKISQVQNQVGKSSDFLALYSSIISIIEKEKFLAPKLDVIQKVFFSQKGSASKQISQLSKLVSRLDLRMNIMVAIPLNVFFFWDIHICKALEKWKLKNASEIELWFKAMAEFEVLSCFANLEFNNPLWAKPIIHSEYFILKAIEAGHPLIPFDRRVNSSLEISKAGSTVIVTGSNMSGKSTFLRTCGVNAVLALAGGVACAEKFEMSHVHIISSMRISDSLEDNTSSFYAELKKLADIIRESEKNIKVFLLLDEILRGTNSNDRYTGSVALIRQLISYNAVTIIATHDLKLADLSMEIPERITNYNFDVKIDGDELYFDYKLTPGICKSLNASILMKKMGIKISETL